MTITAAIVLFSVTWFMVFFMVLPVRYRSQAEAGEVVPGTPASAPAETMLKKKALITTGITAVVWLAFFLVITSGRISIRDFDMTDWIALPPPPVTQPAAQTN